MFVLLNKMSFPVWTKSAEFLVEKLSDGFAVTTTSSVADLGQIQEIPRNKKSDKSTKYFQTLVKSKLQHWIPSKYGDIRK